MRRTGTKSTLLKALDALERKFAERTAELQKAREALHESEARFRSLAEISSDYYWESDTEHRLTRLGWNDALSAVPAMQQPAQVGKRRWDVPYLSPDEAGWRAHRAVLDAHQPFRNFELSRLGADGSERFISISGDPQFDASGAFTGYRGVGTEITERRAAAAKIRRLTQLYAALSQCNQAIVRCAREEDLLPQVCRAAVEFGGMEMAWIGFVDPETRMVLPVARFGKHADAYLQDIEICVSDESPLGCGPAGTAIREGHPVWYQDSQSGPDISPWHGRRARFGWTASASLPLSRGGSAVGALNLYTGETAAFDDAVRDLLIEIAADVSFALDNFERESRRQRAEEALRESEARFRSLTAMSSDWYWESDAEHRFTQRTSSGEANVLSAWMTQSRIGPHCWEIPCLSPDEAGWQAHRTVLDAHLPFRNFELSRSGADGSERHISISGDPTFDAAGRFTGYRGVGTDITERKRAEARLRLAASVFDNAQEAIVITDAAANIVSVNRRFTDITGYSGDEVLGRNPRLLKSGRQDGDFYRAMWASIHAHGYWTGEIWNRRKDGHVFPEWLSISAVRDDHGQVVNYVGVIVDISQRIAAERALRASEEKFAKGFNSSPMFICIATVAEGRYIEVNEGFLSGTGHSREEVIGRTSLDLGLWKTAGDRQRAIDSLLMHGRISGFEAELRKKSGESMFCEIWAEPIEIEGTPCVIWVTNDISVRKKAEMEICQLNAELEQRVAARTQALEVANAELEAFSYSVSHDLRAPLRAIHGFSRLLEQQHAGQIDGQGREMLRRIGAGAQKMAQLIDDLLKLSRISRQAMRVEPVDLSVLAWEVVGDLQADCPERRIAWVIAPQAPAVGDPGLLRVVLQNLIGNAWKYSSRRNDARIEFGVAEKDGRPVYFVRDNGAGFDMARAKNLFRAFQRLHSAAEFQGSGIGLATVARIVQRHGGEAWGEGRVGEGASFYFTL